MRDRSRSHGRHPVRRLRHIEMDVVRGRSELTRASALPRVIEHIGDDDRGAGRRRTAVPPPPPARGQRP